MIMRLCLKVGKLELVHSLENLPNVTPVIFPEKCRMISDSELYVHYESVSSYSDINRELARYFSGLAIVGCTCSQERMNRCFTELK
jgi:hypothetical protein